MQEERAELKAIDKAEAEAEREARSRPAVAAPVDDDDEDIDGADDGGDDGPGIFSRRMMPCENQKTG